MEVVKRFVTSNVPGPVFTTACPSKCSEPASNEPTSRTCSGSMCSSEKTPSVTVPVLSKTAAFTRRGDRIG